METYVRDSSGEILCVYLESVTVSESVKFLELGISSIEIGLMNRGPESPVKLHRHRPRESFYEGRTQEVIVLLQGKLKFGVFTDSGTFVLSRELSGPSIIIFLKGAHEIEFFSRCDLIEFKTGPYLGKLDKIWMNASED